MGDTQVCLGLAASQDPAPPFTWKWPAGHSSEEFGLNSEVWAPPRPQPGSLDACLLPTQWLWPLRMGVKGEGPRKASEGEPTGAGLALRGSPNRVLRSPPSLQGSLPFPPRPQPGGGCRDWWLTEQARSFPAWPQSLPEQDSGHLSIWNDVLCRSRPGEALRSGPSQGPPPSGGGCGQRLGRPTSNRLLKDLPFPSRRDRR